MEQYYATGTGHAELTSSIDLPFESNRIFVTADPHFGHEQVIRNAKRPFNSIDEMDNCLIHRWNSVVSNQDYVIVAGDVAGDIAGHVSERTVNIIRLLNGKKILVMGNHDGTSRDVWSNSGFMWVYDNPIIVNKIFHISHEMIPVGTVVPSNKTFECEAIPPNNPCLTHFSIYGHEHYVGTHNKQFSIFTSNSACVCVEFWNYAPVNLYHLAIRAGFLCFSGGSIPPYMPI